jgi:dTMP kinase
MAGSFIVVEGADGVGKTTLASRMADRLRQEGLEVIEVREPGGTPVAELARAAVLDPALDPCPVAELFLILVARADLVSRTIRPALAAGRIVVGDRYDLSTHAYQIVGRGLPVEAVTIANNLATGGLVPDLTLVLDAPAAVLSARQASQGKQPDRIENAASEVQQRITRAFREARGPGVVHIDATGSPGEVERAAWEHVWGRVSGTQQESVV